jgi:tol-pal system protein YbgF
MKKSTSICIILSALSLGTVGVVSAAAPIEDYSTEVNSGAATGTKSSSATTKTREKEPKDQDQQERKEPETKTSNSKRATSSVSGWQEVKKENNKEGKSGSDSGRSYDASSSANPSTNNDSDTSAADNASPPPSTAHLSTDERIRRLEQQVHYLNKSGFRAKNEELQQKLQKAQGELEVQQHKIASLEKQLDDFYIDLDQRLKSKEKNKEKNGDGDNNSSGNNDGNNARKQPPTGDEPVVEKASSSARNAKASNVTRIRAKTNARAGNTNADSDDNATGASATSATAKTTAADDEDDTATAKTPPTPTSKNQKTKNDRLKKAAASQFMEEDDEITNDARPAKSQPKSSSSAASTTTSTAANATKTTAAATASDDSTTSAKASANPIQEQQTYQASFAYLQKKQFDEGAKKLREYLAAYPNGNYAANAHYWLGEIYFLKNAYAKANSEFDIVVRKYDKSPKVAEAMFKLAYIHDKEGKQDQARKEYMKVKARFPNSSAAKLADQQLRATTAAAPALTSTTSTSNAPKTTTANTATTTTTDQAAQ